MKKELRISGKDSRARSLTDRATASGAVRGSSILPGRVFRSSTDTCTAGRQGALTSGATGGSSILPRRTKYRI